VSEREIFTAGATVTVDAARHDIWAMWVDVNAWTSWDEGVEKVELRGNFKEGNTFALTPRGGEPVEATIVSVTQGEEFVDEVRLPFGVIRTTHRMAPAGTRALVSHEVTAEIDAEAAPRFAGTIWPHLQAGLPTSLLNLADIVGD